MNILKKNISDRDKLISLMNSAADGKFALCNENDFDDKELAGAYNDLIHKFFESGNETAMALNKSMEVIGNCDNVRSMLEIVERQKNSLNTIVGAKEDISESIKKCEEILNAISKNTDSIHNISSVTKKVMSETISNVSKSHYAIIDAADEMKGFSEKFDAIRDILKTVDGIADRTKILSLNAKIEATRSADGDGFAVVAGEIGKLSGDTQASVGRMSEFLYEIIDNIRQLTSRFYDLRDMLDLSNNSARDTERSVIKMADDTRNIINQISNLYNHINIQNSSTKSFADHIVIIAEDSDLLDCQCKKPGKDMYTINRSIDKVRTKYIKGQSCLSEKDLLDIYRVDHLIFTGRLYNMIEGFEKLQLKNLNQPKNCKFGKWMQKLKDENLSKAKLFEQADYYHTCLHKLATSCFYANDAGERKKAFHFFEQAQCVFEKFSEELENLKSNL